MRGCFAVIVTLVLALGAFLLFWFRTDPHSSVVRIHYLEAPGAAPLKDVRVRWNGTSYWPTVLPGEQLKLMINPRGARDLEVSYEWDGESQFHVWPFGPEGGVDSDRYSIDIWIDSTGSVEEKHCIAPCPGSDIGWLEPWPSLVRDMLR